MAITKRADLVIPEILEEAVQGEFAGIQALNGNRAAVVNASMPSTRGGDKIKVPYFGNIGEFDDLATEDDVLVPVRIAMDDDEAVVRHSGKAFETHEWAQMAASYADPYAEAARQIRIGAQRRIDRALIDEANTTPLVNDASTGTISYDAVVDTRMLYGDEPDDIELMVVHSKVMGDMYKLRADGATGEPLLTDARDGGLPRFLGIPVKVSDRMTVTAGDPNTFTTLFLQRASVVFWYNGEITIEEDRDILADTRVAACHIYWCAHRWRRRAGQTKTGVAKLITR